MRDLWVIGRLTATIACLEEERSALVTVLEAIVGLLSGFHRREDEVEERSVDTKEARKYNN